MKASRYGITIALWSITASLFVLYSQETYRARIIDCDSSLPISDASIHNNISDNSTLSDDDGFFQLLMLDTLTETTYTITCLRYQSKEIDIKKKQRELTICLSPISLKLSEIVVTATSKQGYNTASSQIDKLALIHLQPNNLGDALSLLPGIEITTNDNTRSQQGYIRAPTSNTESLISSRGAGILIDGIPISNNGNLQVSNTSRSGIGGQFETVSGQGTDLRTITINNIEQIEVIRGIAPVQYGDMTSGVIDIKREIGVLPQSIIIQSDPNYLKIYTSKGFSIDKQQIVNIDINFQNSSSDLRTPVPNFEQLLSRISHQYKSKNRLWKNNLSADLGYSYDVNKRDKNDLLLEESTSEEKSIRINNSGNINFSSLRSTQLKYRLSWQKKEQNSYKSDLIINSLPISTNIVNDSVYEAPFLPNEFYSAAKINGKPEMLYSQAQAQTQWNTSKLTHYLSFGAEYRLERNNGRGRSFRESEEFHAVNNQRNRSYASLPATTNLSLFFQDRISIPLGKSSATINLGIRYDNYNPESITKGSSGQLIQPRINLGFKLGKQTSLYIGYGISSKLAPMIFRSPDNAYIDAISFTHASAQYPSENLLLATTKVFSTKNKDITYSKMRKYETGGEVKQSILSINYSLYYEYQTDIPSFTSMITPFEYDSYDILMLNHEQQPTIDYLNVDKIISRQSYFAPSNLKTLKRKGADLVISTSKLWKNSGPQLTFSGSYINTEITDSNLEYENSSQTNVGNTDKLIGIYQSEVLETDYLLTSLTLTQHIPKLRFIASLTIQNRWLYITNLTRLAPKPVGYIDKMGVTTWLTETDDIVGSVPFLIKDYSSLNNNTTSQPSTFNTTLRLTKEVTDRMTFSFFINNVFMHNPIWIDTENVTASKINPGLYFCGEVKIKL